MLGGDGGFATARWREPASSDRLPSHRSESPTGYSSAGCSPAEPASASPVTDNSSSIPIQRDNQMRCSTSLKDPVQASVTCLGGATSGAIPDLVRPRPAFGCDAVSCRTGRVRRHWGCHLYFARRVSFLSCADRTPNVVADERLR